MGLYTIYGSVSPMFPHESTKFQRSYTKHCKVVFTSTAKINSNSILHAMILQILLLSYANKYKLYTLTIVTK